MPCRHRSLRLIAPLVARAQGDRPYGTADTTCLRDSISKQGDRYPRSLFVIGALAVIRYAKIHGTKHRPWLTASLARKLAKVAAISLCQQDSANGLGHDGQRRALQRTCRTCSVKEIVSGTLEGGRVVGVVAGLFAGLPPALRESRRRGDKGILVAVSGSDPLNLAGILTPGPRIAALTGNRVLYRDGVPVAALTAGEVSFLGGNSTRPPNGRHVRCCCARCGLPRLRRSWTMSTLSHCFIRNGLTRKLRARYVGGRNSPLSGFQEEDQRSGSSSLQSKHLNFGPFAPILTKPIGWRHFGQ